MWGHRRLNNIAPGGFSLLLYMVPHRIASETKAQHMMTQQTLSGYFTFF